MTAQLVFYEDRFHLATGGFNHVVSLQLHFQHFPTDQAAFIFDWTFQANHHAMAAAFGWHCLAKARSGAKFSYISACFTWIHCVFQGSLHSWSHGYSLELRCDTRQLLYLSGHSAKPWRINKSTTWCTGVLHGCTVWFWLWILFYRQNSTPTLGSGQFLGIMQVCR